MVFMIKFLCDKELLFYKLDIGFECITDPTRKKFLPFLSNRKKKFYQIIKFI